MSVEAILLGMAQDGGLPQAGCFCVACRDAYDHPGKRRWVTCLGLIDRAARQSWLIDATPDFREQIHTLQTLAPDCPLSGIALTHAHVGHYTGLIHLGREAWDTTSLPLYVSPRMAAFLGENAPWSQLVTQGNIVLHPLTAHQERPLGARLSLTPMPVPHRDEFTDTLAFLLRGPARSLFYCPDIDAWDRWDRDLRQVVAAADIALLDGTFFDRDELPGRDVDQIPHPLALDTAARLTGVACDVRLVHLNHTNPLHYPGPERECLTAQGTATGEQGDRWLL
jgi:pyrroloquinoline quinone biosynthesis protein B